jgi:hypothetical protein
MPTKTTKDESALVFQELKGILAKCESRLSIQTDDDNTYYLNSTKLDKKKKPVFFGAVSRKKGVVHFYLMPVYSFPELLETISPTLQARMQGKSCFNFKEKDSALFKELARLTKVGFERYQQEGLA